MGLLNIKATINNINTGYLTPNFDMFTPILGLNNFTNTNFIINKNWLNNSTLFKTKTNSSNISVNESLQNIGYSAVKGQKLANIAKQNATGFKKLCATYVKKDIEQAGLGEYKYGHAYQCDGILSKNPNFKEISTKGLNLETLPAGCVLVYDKGVSRYSKKYGHIEITDGNGNAFSDGKTRNIRPGAKVFVPVSTNYLA